MVIQFNPQQEEIINQAIKWFRNSSAQTFEIMGEAGTGKSVVIYEIIRRLGLKPYQYMPMAYTGQAAIVMRSKGFPHSRSIHSGLYEFQEVVNIDEGSIQMNSQFNTPQTKKVFRPKSPNMIPASVELFVIDEGYIVPDSMRKVIESFGKKILVGGDDGQLPPVTGQPAYFTGYGIHQLTEIMRQAKDNPIVYLAHRARRGQPIHCGLYGDHVMVVEDKDVTKDMVGLMNTIVCATNYTREVMNKYVRESIHQRYFDLPVYGDRMICRNNNWSIEQDNISLVNGLSGFVVNMPSVSDFDGRTFYIDFAPDMGGIVFDDLPVDYKYLKADVNGRKEIKNLPYSYGEKFEYSYALTAYLAQGAEYHTGMYIEEFLRPNMQNNLNYTGITRFKENMIYVKKSKQFTSFFT